MTKQTEKIKEFEAEREGKKAREKEILEIINNNWSNLMDKVNDIWQEKDKDIGLQHILNVIDNSMEDLKSKIKGEKIK